MVKLYTGANPLLGLILSIHPLPHMDDHLPEQRVGQVLEMGMLVVATVALQPAAAAAVRHQYLWVLLVAVAPVEALMHLLVAGLMFPAMAGWCWWQQQWQQQRLP